MIDEILLVDDDDVTNFVHQHMIKIRFPNIPIRIESNGAAALEYILKKPFNEYLILLDLNMPVMSGLDFLKAIENDVHRFNLKIYVLSSSIDLRDKHEVDAFSHVESFLQKPLRDNLLDELINTYKIRS
ncbi:response regulator [Flagellimonas lutimaris]|uniref:Response regulator n=1 Tax=Flagellimonas lutimaris TaxID=475082 RepID=A0A3A1NH65_9FLAO|nr:response regulator [Allomuricauda lutimaris]RIV37703.1 response regulator [Allomuricauda lutimaris]